MNALDGRNCATCLKMDNLHVEVLYQLKIRTVLVFLRKEQWLAKTIDVTVDTWETHIGKVKQARVWRSRDALIFTSKRFTELISIFDLQLNSVRRSRARVVWKDVHSQDLSSIAVVPNFISASRKFNTTTPKCVPAPTCLAVSVRTRRCRCLSDPFFEAFFLKRNWVTYKPLKRPVRTAVFCVLRKGMKYSTVYPILRLCRP